MNAVVRCCDAEERVDVWSDVDVLGDVGADAGGRPVHEMCCPFAFAFRTTHDRSRCATRWARSMHVQGISSWHPRARHTAPLPRAWSPVTPLSLSRCISRIQEVCGAHRPAAVDLRAAGPEGILSYERRATRRRVRGRAEARRARELLRLTKRSCAL